MGITIDKPIVLAESQLKRFQSLVIAKDLQGKLMAQVSFVIVCPVSGSILKEEILTYSNEQYNEFWNNFNNGKFLYGELVKTEEEEIEIPDEVESDFLNEIGEE